MEDSILIGVLEHLMFWALIGSVFLLKLSQNDYDKEKLAQRIKEGWLLRRGIPRDCLNPRAQLMQKISLVLILFFGAGLISWIWNQHFG